LNEQARIVAKIEELFTKLDAGIDALRAIQKQIKRYRQAVLRDAVTGELTKAWREENQAELEPADALLKRILTERRERWEQEQLKKFAESGKPPKNDDWKKKYKEPAAPSTENLPELPNGWTWAIVAQLGTIGEQPVLTGPFGTNLGRGDFITDGIPVLTIGCLKLQGIELNKAVYISEEKASELNQYRLKSGDLLFSRMAAVGRAGIVPLNLEGCLFNYHIMRLRLADWVLLPKLFVSYVRGSTQVENYLKEVNHGATRDGINTEQLLNLPVSLPPLAEQQKIVEEVERLLSVADAVEATVKQSLKQAERLRQSILKRAFEGKLALQDETDEPAEILLKRIKQEREKIDKSKKTKGKFTRKNQKENKQAKLF
jgi:type I restriction enzyme S subunit